MHARPLRLSEIPGREVRPGLDGHGEKSATEPKTRAESVGEGPLSRLPARQNHARGLRRLRFPGVRADVPDGQEDPEEDGHESALRLPKLPPTRAIPALRGSGRGRRVRVLAGQVLADARRHFRKRSQRRDPRRSTRGGGRPGPLSVPARDARARPLREAPRHPGRSRAQRSGFGAGLLHQLHPVRELLRPGDAARGRPGRLAGERRIEWRRDPDQKSSQESRAEAHWRFPC
jgi:hypothetical protein